MLTPSSGAMRRPCLPPSAQWSRNPPAPGRAAGILLGLVGATGLPPVPAQTPGATPPAIATPAAPAPPDPASQEFRIQQVIEAFREHLRTPGTREALQAPGAVFAYHQARYYEGRRQPMNVALWSLLWSDMEPAARRLLEEADPLMARMAMALLAYPDTRVKPDAIPMTTWLEQALAKHPDDPELLLAFAQFGRPGFPPPEAAFLRGLELLKETPDAGWGRLLRDWGAWDDPPCRGLTGARAITQYVRRVQPSRLPSAWTRHVEQACFAPSEQGPGEDVGDMVRVVFRYGDAAAKDWNAGRDWVQRIGLMKTRGEPALAQEIAAALAAFMSGPLESRQETGAANQLWNIGETLPPTGPRSQGWYLLETAAGSQPARLADRVLPAARRDPQDESIALAALLLLTQTMEGPFTAAALEFLQPMNAVSRHRVLTYASALLPESRLPAALCLEAWEGYSRHAFTLEPVGGSSFRHGLWALERLHLSGAGEAVRRVLVHLPAAVEKVLIFPYTESPVILRLMQAHGSAPDRTALAHALAPHYRTDRLADATSNWPQLSANLRAFAENPDIRPFPDTLHRRVATVLEQAGAGKFDAPDPYINRGYLPMLLSAALIHREFKDSAAAVIRHLAALPGEQPENRAWRGLRDLLELLESGRALPEPAMKFTSTAPGTGTLSWTLRDVLRPPPVEVHPLNPLMRFPTLPVPLAEACGATFSVETLDPPGERVVARLERFTPEGKLILEGLPATGRLICRFTQRSQPFASGSIPPLGYHSLPILADTASWLPWGTASPEGWQVLGLPVPLDDAGAWYLSSGSGEIPATVQVLLLDAAGRVCAASPRPFQNHLPPAVAAGFSGVVISRSSLTADGLPANSPDPNPGLPVTSGNPTHLVLAQRAGEQAAPQHPLPPLRLQPWPEPGGGPVAAGRRLEVIRQWIPDASKSKFTVGGEPLHAAWFDAGRLFIQPLDADATAREISFPHLQQGWPDQLFWQGPRLHFVARILSPAGDRAETSVCFAIDPSHPMRVAEVLRIASRLRFQQDFQGIPGVVLVQARKTVAGLIDMRGRFLPYPPDDPGLPVTFLHAVSPTRVAASRGEDGALLALDWTDGVLKLLPMEGPLPPPMAFADQFFKAFTGYVGEVEDPRKTTPQLLRVPYGFKSFRWLGDGRILAQGSSSFTLLRVVP